MKYIKTFEDTKNIPKKGDYVIMKSESNDERIQDFINNNIGRIKEYWPGSNVRVRFYDVPTYFGDTVRLFSKNQIVAFAPTKKELELKLSINKYNL